MNFSISWKFDEFPNSADIDKMLKMTLGPPALIFIEIIFSRNTQSIEEHPIYRNKLLWWIRKEDIGFRYFFM